MNISKNFQTGEFYWNSISRSSNNRDTAWRPSCFFTNMSGKTLISVGVKKVLNKLRTENLCKLYFRCTPSPYHNGSRDKGAYILCHLNSWTDGLILIYQRSLIVLLAALFYF
jgi:hypothetical protein